MLWRLTITIAETLDYKMNNDKEYDFFPQIDCNYTYCVLFQDSANRVSAKRVSAKREDTIFHRPPCHGRRARCDTLLSGPYTLSGRADYTSDETSDAKRRVARDEPMNWRLMNSSRRVTRHGSRGPWTRRRTDEWRATSDEWWNHRDEWRIVTSKWRSVSAAFTIS